MDNQFQDALNEATATTAAKQSAATAASLDQSLADIRQQKIDALRDPSHPFHRAPMSYWQTQEATVMAFRVRAWLAPDVAPPSPQALAAEQHAASFPLPDQLHENMQAALGARVEPFAGDSALREEATAALKRELTPAGYEALVKDAGLYKTLTDAEKADRITLQAYAAQGRRNAAKAGRR
jgi:hypothetical protein